MFSGERANREHLWTATHLIKNIVEAIDYVEEDWEQGKISGSRAAHLNEVAIEATKMWYRNYLDALDETTEAIGNEAKKLEIKNETSSEKLHPEWIGRVPKKKDCDPNGFDG